MTIQKPFAVIPHALGTIATGNEKANYPAAHVGQFEDAGMVWESAGNTNVFIRGDFGSPRDIDFIALLGTNATASTTFSLRLGDTQAHVDGIAPYDSSAQLIRNPAITRDDGVYHSHFDLPSMQTRRWWRIDINSHTGDFRCMAVVMGFKRQFTSFYNRLGFEFGQEDMGSVEFGRYGVAAREGGIKMRTLAMEFGWLSDSDRHNKFQPLRDAIGTTGMALWCFDPDPTVQRQDKTYFGWLRKPAFFKPSSFKQDLFGAQFDIISII